VFEISGNLKAVSAKKSVSKYSKPSLIQVNWRERSLSDNPD
jgi:hypothetical protein